jgi:hypothetical protein
MESTPALLVALQGRRRCKARRGAGLEKKISLIENTGRAFR